MITSHFLFSSFRPSSLITPPAPLVSVVQQQRPPEVSTADGRSSASGVKRFQSCTKKIQRKGFNFCLNGFSFVTVGHSHIFRPHIVKPVARPSSPSPFCADAPPPPAATALSKSHPSEPGNHRQSLPDRRCPPPLICSSLVLVCSSSGVQGKWPTPGGDLTSVPLLSSPDLDALCDPATPAPSASLPCSSPPPRSSSISSAALSSMPSPPSHPPHPPLTSTGLRGRAASSESPPIHFQQMSSR